MLQELFEYGKQNIFNIFTFFGSLIAFILVILRIWEYKKKRVSLNITLEQERFTSSRIEDYGDETKIEIKADLKNTGLEPTTLVGVDFYSDNELLNKLEMRSGYINLNPGLIGKFDAIRIEPNDRKILKIFTSKNVLLPNDIKELNARLIFKTTHKDIQKKIKLIGKDEIFNEKEFNKYFGKV